MKTVYALGLTLALAAASAPFRPARADAALSLPQRQQIWALAQDIVSVGIAKDFRDGAIPNRQLVRFGIYQVALRQPKLLQYDVGGDKGTARVSDKAVAAAALRYFGKTVRHQSLDNWTYHDGFYNGYGELFEQLGDGEITGFRIERAPANRLTVYVNHVEPMATTKDGRDIIVRTKLTLKPALTAGKQRYIVDGFAYLTPKP